MTSHQKTPTLFLSLPHPCSYLPGRMSTSLFLDPRQKLDSEAYAGFTRPVSGAAATSSTGRTAARATRACRCAFRWRVSNPAAANGASGGAIRTSRCARTRRYFLPSISRSTRAIRRAGIRAAAWTIPIRRNTSTSSPPAGSMPRSTNSGLTDACWRWRWWIFARQPVGGVHVLRSG